MKHALLNVVRDDNKLDNVIAAESKMQEERHIKLATVSVHPSLL